MPRRNQQTQPAPEQTEQEQREDIHEAIENQEEGTVVEAPTEAQPAEETAPAPHEEPNQEAARSEAAPAPVSEQRNQPAMLVTIKGGDPANDILATAEVEIAGFGTFRNIRIKNGDYGPRVAMPMTKMPMGGWRDVFYFESREMREQFDKEILSAYRQTMGMSDASYVDEPELEPDDMDMSM